MGIAKFKPCNRRLGVNASRNQRDLTPFPLPFPLQIDQSELQPVNEFPGDQIRDDIIDGTEEPVIPRAAG
jgi:hypothetical protein